MAQTDFDNISGEGGQNSPREGLNIFNNKIIHHEAGKPESNSSNQPEDFQQQHLQSSSLPGEDGILLLKGSKVNSPKF